MIDAGRILFMVYNAHCRSRGKWRGCVSTLHKARIFPRDPQSVRTRKAGFFLCDEFQAFFTVGRGVVMTDAFERTRQLNHANIVAFQKLNALSEADAAPEAGLQSARQLRHEACSWPNTAQATTNTPR